MEPTQPTASVQNVNVSTKSPTKLPVTLTFLAAILFFFLPFVEIKCNGSTMARATGFDLAIGNEMKPAGTMKSLGDLGNSFSQESSSVTKTNNEKNLDPNIFAIVALGLAVLGFIIMLVGKSSKLTGVLGVLGIIAMIALIFDVKSQVKDQQMRDIQMQEIKITVDLAAGYFLTMIAFIAVAIIGLRKKKAVQEVATQPSVIPLSSSNLPPGENPTTAQPLPGNE